MKTINLPSKVVVSKVSNDLPSRARVSDRKTVPPVPGNPKGGGKPNDVTWHPNFISSLRVSPNISAAARACGVSVRTVNLHKAKFPGFAADWDEAWEEGADNLEAEAMRRAIHGTSHAVYQQGKKVGSVQKYSDALIIFLLKCRRPEIYGNKITRGHTRNISTPTIETQPPQTEMVPLESPIAALRAAASLGQVSRTPRDTPQP